MSFQLDLDQPSEAGLLDVFQASWEHLSLKVLGLSSVPETSVKKLHPTAILRSSETMEPLGFCSVKGEVLNRLYVHPKYHGLGAGKILLKSAVEHGARRLWVDEGNLPARTFYERQGWAWDGTTDPGRYWPELVVLSYRLAV